MLNIVIIDTGIDINSPILSRYRGELCGIKVIKDKKDSYKVITTMQDPLCINDDVGHGTAITGIILSHNTDVSLFFVKLFDRNMLYADEDALIFALEYIYNNVDVDIINLSLGLCSLKNNFKLFDICEKYYEKEKYIISAFDNHGSISFPAAFENVIGVTSDEKIYHSDEYYILPYTTVNICAKGHRQKVFWNNSSQIFAAGNSFACAHFTGIVSKMINIIDYKKFWEYLRSSSDNKTKSNIIHNDLSINPTTNYKNVVAFPFSKEIQSLIRFQNKLSFNLVDIYDTKYSARIGASTNKLLNELLPNDFIIKNITEINWNSFDAIVLGHMDKIVDLIGEEFLEKLVKEIIHHQKSIYTFDDISKYSENTGQVFYPSISSDNCKQAPLGKLYRQDKPVLAVFGTSSKQGKFTIQLEIRYELLQRGYKLFQLGTEPSALLYGMDSVFPIGYNTSVSISERKSIGHINKILYEGSRDADIIIIGGQSSVLPLDEGNLDFFNYSAIDLLYATLPDAVILCINPTDEIDFVKRTINFIESIANCKVIALIMYPFHYMQNDILQQRPIKMTKQIFCDEYKERFSKEDNVPVILPTTPNDIIKLCDIIEEYFS